MGVNPRAARAVRSGARRCSASADWLAQQDRLLRQEANKGPEDAVAAIMPAMQAPAAMADDVRVWHSCLML
jgi:hypothetical protein